MLFLDDFVFGYQLSQWSTDSEFIFRSPFQAVDVVGQAGKPKSITGFQTHTTPVLLAHGERAELATEECIFSNRFIHIYRTILTYYHYLLNVTLNHKSLYTLFVAQVLHIRTFHYKG